MPASWTSGLNYEFLVQCPPDLRVLRVEKEITKLDESERLHLVIGKFADIDQHPDAVPIFEDLIRRFKEASNETAG